MHDWNPGLRIQRTEFSLVQIGKSVLCGAIVQWRLVLGPGSIVNSSQVRGGFDGPVMAARVGAGVMGKDTAMENSPAD